MKIVADKASAYRASDRFQEVSIKPFVFVRHHSQTLAKRSTPEEHQADLYSWECETHVPFWGDSLRIHFLTTVDQVSPPVAKRIVDVLTYEQCLRDGIDATLAQYYQSTVLSRFEFDASGRKLPRSPSIKKLRAMYGKPDLHLDAYDDSETPKRFSLYFTTSWNVEYPVELVIDGWSIQRVR
ncbi:hypothetical protein Mal15_10000 [Stieleria maiorica]|uniref:Uncharacterized protein n=1 Tax=Stieleria maiorica TaxID=2795974 RepID=A0A5B9MA79_9BACT|nr:hypothetical protein [Stieleria maiorica]QEF96970.1 hypothetical protein Mal15_10000 [Stieleria maiorica]